MIMAAPDQPDGPVWLHGEDHAVSQKVQDQGVHGTLPDLVGVSVFVGVERDPILQPLGQVRVLAENAFTH